MILPSHSLPAKTVTTGISAKTQARRDKQRRMIPARQRGGKENDEKSVYCRSATRSVALRARGFSSTSSSEALTSLPIVRKGFGVPM